MPPVRDLDALIRGMEPVLHDGTFVFAASDPGVEIALGEIVAYVREAEGPSFVVEEAVARRCGLTPLSRCAWITLTVHSDLEAVGLTAAVSAALAREGIACNVVAGARHDHLFVPIDRGHDALAALRRLSRDAASPGLPGPLPTPDEFARRYADAWSGGKPDAVAALFSEHGSLVINDGEPAVGRAAVARVAADFMTAFPDLEVTCDRMALEDGSWRWYWTMRGTNSGPGGWGRPIDIRGFEALEFDEEGLIRVARGHFDQVDYDRQLAPVGG